MSVVVKLVDLRRNRQVVHRGQGHGRVLQRGRHRRRNPQPVVFVVVPRRCSAMVEVNRGRSSLSSVIIVVGRIPPRPPSASASASAAAAAASAVTSEVEIHLHSLRGRLRISGRRGEARDESGDGLVSKVLRGDAIDHRGQAGVEDQQELAHAVHRQLPKGQRIAAEAVKAAGKKCNTTKMCNATNVPKGQRMTSREREKG